MSYLNFYAKPVFGRLRAIVPLLAGAMLLLTGTVTAQTPQYITSNVTGTGCNNFPFNTATASNKIQWLYTSGEFAGCPSGKAITTVYVKPCATATQTYNLTVKLGQSNLTSFTAGSYITSGMTTVYSGSISLAATANTWLPIKLTTPFVYDPSKSLVLEIHNANIGSGGFTINQISPGGNRRLYNGGASADGTQAVAGIDVKSLASNDAAVSGISAPVYFCPGTYDIKVDIENQGTNQIKGVTVNWSKDGVAQTPITHSGTLDTFGGSGSRFATIKLGSFTWSSSTSLNLKVWTSSPNSTTDGSNLNDTLLTVMKPSLSGTYTVGGSSPNYTKLQDAINDLVSYGVCGPITLDIRSGTYSGRTIIAAIPGASSTNTITIKGAGASSTILTYASTSTTDLPTVLLEGADYITIKNLKVANTGSANGFGIQLMSAADYNVIENCDISVNATSTGATNAGIVMSGSATSATTAGMSGSYNIIRNNTITGGYYGITVMGSGTTAFVMGNQVLNNSITNYYYYGMYIYYGGEAKVIGNTITTSRNTTAYGMLFYYQSNFEVSRNDILVPYYGIYCYYANYYSYNASGTQATINNNFFNSSNLYGAYIYYPQYLNLHYNTIRGNSTYTVYIYNPNQMDVRGNIFWNTGTGYAFYANLGSFKSIDYNIYFGSAANLIYFNTAYSSLAAWQTAIPQYNAGSWQQDPKLSSASDLHISQTAVVPWGPADMYMEDIDGDSRCLLAPTIGADESSYLKNQKPTAGMSGPDTMYVNSYADFSGNQTPGVPHGNRWYVDNVLMKDSVDFSVAFSSTGSYVIKVVAYGCIKNDSAAKTVVVVNPTSAPSVSFISDKNVAKPGDVVTLTELTTGGATELKWEITPVITYDANGNAVDRYTYQYGGDSTRMVKIQFDYPGTYKVCLTASNTIGSTTVCKDAYIKVDPAYSLNPFSFNATESQGYIYDDGGRNGNYAVSSSTTVPRKTSMVIAPCASEVYLMFNSFELECGYDYLRIYDGEDNTGTPLHTCTGNANGNNGPGLTGTTGSTCGTLCRPSFKDTFKAVSGKMYIEMTSDYTGAYPGFEAFWWSKPKQVDPPDADFDFPSTICVDIPVDFTNKSTGEALTFQWDLDDDMSVLETSAKDAAFVYFVPGKYTITLIVSNCGGTDTVQHDITVISPNGPGVAFSADNTNPTTSDIVRFTPDIKECVSEYRWRFTAASGPGKAVFMNGTKNTSMSPQVIFTDTGCYHAFLYAKNSGGEDSLELICFISVKSPYCVPSVTTNVADLGISEVGLATATGQVLLSNKSSQGVEDYQSFVSTISATVESGVSYDLKVSRGSSLNEISRTAWIDWNLDGDFNDANEKLGEQKKSSAASWTVRFTVPTSASVGASVLRIASNQGSLANAPCGPNKYGEYEDYRIYITPDLTIPVITLLGGDTVYVEQGYSYTEAGATAEDNLDGDITGSVKKSVVPAFDNLIPGTYLVHFDVQDKAGNPAERVTRVVIVTPDATPPSLIVPGTDTIYVDVFDANFTMPDAFLSEDLVDGDLTGEVTRIGAVDVNTVGTYVVTYSVSDQNGNATSVIRTVIVRDQVVPVIARTGADTVRHEVNTPYVDAGATATDNYCDNAATTAAVITTGNVNEKRLGTYTVVYTLTDCNGNPAAPVTRVVIVEDTKAPALSLKGDSLVILDVFDTYVNDGVNVSDNYGTPVVTLSGSFLAEFPDMRPTRLGDYVLVYTAVDSVGNMSTVSRIIRVEDREAPTITLEGIPTANVCRWDPYTDAGYTLSDNYDTAVTVTTEGDYENTLMPGMFSMRYKAVDHSGNTAYSEWRIIRVLDRSEGNCITTGLGNAAGLEEHVQVFPNPTTGRFTIRFDLGTAAQVDVRIVNALGQVVASPVDGHMSAGTYQVDLSGQASGVYLLYITAGDQSAVKRIVIAR